MRKRIKAHQGFSMIELMVALVLGLLVVLAVMQIFLSASKTYKMTEDMSRIQENGRFAMEYLKWDIRQAGFWGCLKNVSSSAVRSHLNDAAGNPKYDFTGGIGGAESDGYESSTNPVLKADSILFTSGGAGGQSPLKVLRDAPPTSEGPIKSVSTRITPNSGLKENQIIVITDCKTADIFQITNISTSKDFDLINYTTSPPKNEEEEPGNKSLDMTKNYHGASIANTFSVANNWYEIRENAHNEPALYRNYDVTTGVGEELVEGIESMQFLYGIASGADKSVSVYQTFDNVINAEDIVSVKVILVVRGLADNMTDTPVTFTIDDNGDGTLEPYTAKDRRLRKVFSSTVAIRNRLN